jgi:phosphoribosylformylglycinamidine cyclo-ligase
VARIARGTWEIPPIFELVRSVGAISTQEMYGVFNMGVGMVLIVDPSWVDRVVGVLGEEGEDPLQIGTIVSADRNGGGVILV